MRQVASTGLGGVLGTILDVVPTLNLAAGLTIASGMLAWLLLPKHPHAGSGCELLRHNEFEPRRSTWREKLTNG